MPNWVPSWPTKGEYDEAMKRWKDNLGDTTLKSGNLSMSMGTTPRHYERGGLYAIVYKIGGYQVRCFCSDVAEKTDPPADIIQRYQKITHYIATKRPSVPALIATSLNLDRTGVYVAGQWRPVLKTEWLQNVTSLGSYVDQYHNFPDTMRALSDSWRLMTRQLETAQIAHGDLDITNVLVQQVNGQPTLRLIDYDNMWVPELARAPQTECGHEAFQHPAFFFPVDKPLARHRPYNLEMDRFSALVIYLSLLALSIRGSLFAELGAREDQRLLFERADYENPTLATSNIQRVQSRCGYQVTPYVAELVACLLEKRMPRALDAIGSAPLSATSAGNPTRPPMLPARPAPMTVPRGSKTRATGSQAPTGPTPPPSYTPMPGYASPAPPSGAQVYAPPPSPGSYQQPASFYAPTMPSAAPAKRGLSSAVIITTLVILIIIAACILLSQLGH